MLKSPYRMIKIYELRNPNDTTNQPRYVGYTKLSLEDRLVDHLKPSHLVSRTHKINWINSIKELGILPTIHLIEEVETIKEAWQREIYWIDVYRKLGYSITNSTNGGKGSVGCVAREETRIKIAKNSTGRKMSEDNKRKLILANKGRKFTIEHKEKLSKAKMGIKPPLHVIEAHRLGTIKAIIVEFDNGEIKEFESVKACSEYLHYKLCTISNILKYGRRKGHHFVIKYKNK